MRPPKAEPPVDELSNDQRRGGTADVLAAIVVVLHRPSLADKVARSTTAGTLDENAAEIGEIVNGASDAVA